MRRLLTTIVALAIAGLCYASEPYTVYCTIKGECRANQLGSLIGDIEIDFGEHNNRKNHIVANDGTRPKFKSMVEAANYLARYGWRLHSTYSAYNRKPLETRALDTTVIVWILEKQICSPDQIREGIAANQIDYLCE